MKITGVVAQVLAEPLVLVASQGVGPAWLDQAFARLVSAGRPA